MIDTAKNCTYCSGFLNQMPSTQPYDQILHKTANFVVVPTRGALLEGWLLIVPKRHILSMLDLYGDEKLELLQLTQYLSNGMREIWGPTPTIFEHGAARSGDAIGCGIDHAHWHIAPLTFSLDTAIHESDVRLKGNWTTIDTLDTLWSKIPHGSNYLMYSEYERKTKTIIPTVTVSQYFRRVIAKQANIPDRFDYNHYEFYENLQNTIYKFREHQHSGKYLSTSDHIAA